MTIECWWKFHVLLNVDDNVASVFLLCSFSRCRSGLAFGV